MIARDGTVRWFRDAARLVAGNEGRYWHGVLLDITRQQQAVLWGWGLAAYALFCGWCAWLLWKRSAQTAVESATRTNAELPDAGSSLGQRVLWLLLPRGAAMRWLGGVAIFPMFLVLPPSPKQGELWVTLLDVGQGLATVVRTARHAMVYDTGPRWNPDADSGNRIIAPYLRGEGIRVLDALVVSHADEDHAGGAKSIIDMRNPKWVLTSMEANSEILRGASEIMRCEWADSGGDRWHWDGVDFEVIHPAKDAYSVTGAKTNNLGCVLKITAPGGSILMTADIEKQAENELLTRFKDEPAVLKSDVLVVPHHGSRTSSTDAFIDAVLPTMALVPVGYRSRFRHPNSAVMDRYAARTIPIYRTDLLGAITLKFAQDADGKPTMSTFRQERQRYWIDQPQRSASAAVPE